MGISMGYIGVEFLTNKNYDKNEEVSLFIITNT